MMFARWWFLGLLLAALVGCGASGEEELRQWMAQQRSEMRPHVAPLAAPKQFKPEAYTQAGPMEPFSKEKLTQALQRSSTRAAQESPLIVAERARRKEALEGFPLDAMSMVGSMVKEGKPAALIKVDKLLYQVRPGSYLGQNFGRVMQITETEMVLREIVQDAMGEWIERPAALQLQEGPK